MKEFLKKSPNNIYYLVSFYAVTFVAMCIFILLSSLVDSI